MEMPKPTEAHRKLEKLAGEWSGEEKLHPSPWDPKGGPATGRAHNRVALDGFAVIHDYEQERGGAITFRGHGVFSYDAGKKEYVMHWWDSMGMPPNEFRGTWQGDVLTVTAPGSQGHSRAVWDLSEKGVYRFQMDVSQDGKQWMTFMEGRYTRR